jgi:hypothetical protein
MMRAMRVTSLHHNCGYVWGAHKLPEFSSVFTPEPQTKPKNQLTSTRFFCFTLRGDDNENPWQTLADGGETLYYLLLRKFIIMYGARLPPRRRSWICAFPPADFSNDRSPLQIILTNWYRTVRYSMVRYGTVRSFRYRTVPYRTVL